MTEFVNIYVNYFFLIIMIGIIFYDFFTMLIPNWLNLVLFGGFIAMIFLTKIPLQTVGWHLLAAFITLTVGFGAFALNLFGGGDAKSIAAIAAWFGFSTDTILFLVLMAILGGVFAILLLIIRFMNFEKMLTKKISQIAWVKAIITPKMRMPYGVAIGAAGLIIYSPDKWI